MTNDKLRFFFFFLSLDVFTSGRLIVAITHFDEHYRKKHKSLPVETQKQHIIDGIKAAVGIDFFEDNIICVSGQMALCSRELCFTQNDDVVRDAEDYMRYCPEFSGPMGQDSKIGTHTIAECLEKKSGILDLEEWYVSTRFIITIMFNSKTKLFYSLVAGTGFLHTLQLPHRGINGW